MKRFATACLVYLATVVTMPTVLATRLEEGQAARMARQGRVSYNRLTRDEYVNTIRDLIGIHFDATDPAGFLADPDWRVEIRNPDEPLRINVWERAATWAHAEYRRTARGT